MRARHATLCGMPVPTDDVAALQRSLRTKLRAAGDDAAGEMVLTRTQVRLLLDELGRVQQSGDRLRRQNRRLRLRLQRHGADAPNEPGDLGDESPDSDEGGP